ncbi:MAG: Eco57I restriction-modification methylase domain-containing protein [Verrucomicrobiota bacterium]
MELLLFEKTWKDVWDGREPHEPVGAVFTKPAIVETILDLAGYKPESSRLADFRLFEPSCGDGAFLTQSIRRLLRSELHWKKRIDWSDRQLDQAITASDLNSGFIALARKTTVELLCAEGCPVLRAGELAEHWVRHADFLLTSWRGTFDFVVGNPPYVRIEDLPAAVLQRYRELYRTCTDRADLYVAFFEKGLRLLSRRGCLAYICANRFAKNLYGRELRQLIAREYRVRYYLNLEHTQPFETQVSAYPCIAVIDRQRGQPTRAATLSDVQPETLATLSQDDSSAQPTTLATFPNWYLDGAPWIATERRNYDRMVALAESCPTLENSAPETKVGIGVATGADDIYVLKGLENSVESTCQLPLVMAADISPQSIDWSGCYLMNPFADSDDGSLRDLAQFPGLKAYFTKHRAALEARHVAQKRAENWYRTIDRVNLQLTRRPKLVIPDIQSGGVIGYDEGRYYPHHNVYWVTSRGWNLRALQALLRSSLVLEQVRAHSVQMRGGAIRYQAQVLRKVRVPSFSALSPKLVELLAEVSTSTDQAQIDALATQAFVL